MPFPPLHNPGASVFVPAGQDPAEAWSTTTHLAIGAHADDLEIMAFHGIASCARHATDRFSGIVCTDGAGSPRGGRQAATTPEALRAARRAEQIEAARIGNYAAVVQLDYTSASLRGSAAADLTRDVAALLARAAPRVLYTHNPFDAHATHLAVLRCVVNALRALPSQQQPAAFYGCEVWRSLDWMPAEGLVELELPRDDTLWPRLLGCFRSQIDAGKRYDLAAPARALANATFREPRAADSGPRWLAVDLLPLLRQPTLSLASYAESILNRFHQDIPKALRDDAGP